MTPTEEFNVKLHASVNQKLANSMLYSLMTEFVEDVSKYPGAHIEVEKDKRVKAIEGACKPLYQYHTVFNVPMNEYGNSVVLIGSDQAVDYMVSEAALFAAHLDVFYAQIKKANNVQELKKYYEKFNLKPKAILDTLLEDLKVYAEKYQFPLDIKGVVTDFKLRKQSFTSEIENK